MSEGRGKQISMATFNFPQYPEAGEIRAELIIDLERLTRRLALKAMRNTKTRTTKLFGDMIVCKVRPSREDAK